MSLLGYQRLDIRGARGPFMRRQRCDLCPQVGERAVNRVDVLLGCGVGYRE
jgi:hypothetical protein